MIGLCVAATSLSAPTAAGAAEARSESVFSTQALVAWGSFERQDPRSASTFGSGLFQFVIPTGTCVASSLATDYKGSVGPRVDLCRPWAGFSAQAVKVSSDWSNGNTTECTNVANTPSFSDGYPVTDPHWRNSGEVKPRSGLYFDITCELPPKYSFGGDYDFLRVAIDAQDPWLFDHLGPSWITRPLGTTYRVESAIGDDNEATQSVVPTLYGHDAGGFHEISRGWGRAHVMASQVSATVVRGL